jgi:hypothetical protein
MDDAVVDEGIYVVAHELFGVGIVLGGVLARLLSQTS